MSNSTKVIEENINNNHFGFESALFIPANKRFQNSQEERIEDFNDLFIYKSKFESSNNLESNEAQKRNAYGNLNFQSLISQDLMKKIEDCSPMKSAEAQKFSFMDLKVPPRVLFNKPIAAAQNLNNQQQNEKANNFNFFLEDAFQSNFTKENLQSFNSCFMQNPFFAKATEESKNPELANLIGETEMNASNYDKFDSFDFQNFNNNIHKDDNNNKNLNEELLFSKLLESLNVDNDSNLEGGSDISISDLENNINFTNAAKKRSDINSNLNSNNENSEKKNVGDSYNTGQNNSTLLQNININNNFNYNLGNSLSYASHYNYLMSLNPYLLNASMLFKLNYLQKLQNYLLSINKINTAKSSNYQFGKAGWTCLYCNNFNYEIRIKCNRCGKLPQNKKDNKPKEDIHINNIDNVSFLPKKANLFTEDKKLLENKSFFTIKAENSKTNFAESKKVNEISSNANINSEEFIQSSFKDSNIFNKTSKCTTSNTFENKVFNNSNYPVSTQNQNNGSSSSNQANILNNNNNFAPQKKAQNICDKMNKFNNAAATFTDCSAANDDSLNTLASKENRTLFSFSSSTNKSDYAVNNCFCQVDKASFYSNAAYMQNQFLYNQSTPINKFNSFNGNNGISYLNNFKQAEIDSTNFLNLNNNNVNRKSSAFESQKANLTDNNKFNLLENSDSQLRQRANTVMNPLDLQAEKKKKKPFVERVGDWVCLKCKNLNFSFRLACNRCQLTKFENEKLNDGTRKKSL